MTFSPDELNERFIDTPPDEVLAWFSTTYRGKIVFSTSLGAEDQALLHLIASHGYPISVFTLDTGRLFQETYDLIQVAEAKYGIRINLFFPDHDNVEKMVRERGINLFYENVENRKLCCHVRKIAPLQRALQGQAVWITGLRRNQAVTRQEMKKVEWDSINQILKVNPLLSWTETFLWDYITRHQIPVNELHQKGYPSIGCQPCTRAIAPGEDIRAGRWWWESPHNKECGLHQPTKPDKHDFSGFI